MSNLIHHPSVTERHGSVIQVKFARRPTDHTKRLIESMAASPWTQVWDGEHYFDVCVVNLAEMDISNDVFKSTLNDVARQLLITRMRPKSNGANMMVLMVPEGKGRIIAERARAQLGAAEGVVR